MKTPSLLPLLFMLSFLLAFLVPVLVWVAGWPFTLLVLSLMVAAVFTRDNPYLSR